MRLDVCLLMNSSVSTLLIGGLFLSCARQADPPQAPSSGSESATASGSGTRASASAPVLRPLVAKTELEARIPAAVGEWSRIELHSITQKLREGEVVDEIAQADGVYRIGDGETRVYVSLLDTRGFKSTHASFRTMRDQPSAGITPFEQQGYPAVEMFCARPLQTILQVLIDDRFLILVTGEGSDPPTVRKFLEAMDLKEIARLR